MTLSRFWDTCLITIEYILDSFQHIGEDIMIKSVAEVYSDYIGIGDDFVADILDKLGLESLTMLGVLFGLFGLYMIYQFGTWVFNSIT